MYSTLRLWVGGIAGSFAALAPETASLRFLEAEGPTWEGVFQLGGRLAGGNEPGRALLVPSHD